ncbi:rhomboid-like protein [Anaeramoeba ignava]|uniref:rhomboid protease n=1 Tax=Anaeramoeba ignava TaxID=1746090 RepID=A0A9Q0R9X1_ANAIG|nr:rhomboid-like protein [Anaeramoeba ignava]
MSNEIELSDFEKENQNQNKKEKKSISRIKSFSKKFKGNFGFLNKNEQKQHDILWKAVSFYKQKPRKLMPYSKTILKFADDSQIHYSIDTNSWLYPNQGLQNIDLEKVEQNENFQNIANKEEEDESIEEKEYLEMMGTHFPYFTWIVSLADLVVLIAGILKYGLASPKQNIWIGPPFQALIDMGAKDGELMKQGQWYRFFVPMFLHAGFVHLLSNLLFQLTTARLIEKMIGTIRFAIIYLLSGVGSVLMSVLFLPELAGVGASGSLFGILGVLLCELAQNWNDVYRPKTSLFLILLTILLSLGVGLLPSIDNFAHLGGLITGSLAGVVLLPYLNFGTTRKILVVICFPLLLFLFVIGFILFYHNVDVNGWCRFCKYCNCLPLNNGCKSIGQD